MTRTAIYLRVSLDQTGEELAVTRQREDALALAAEKGWEVADVYQDNSLSASKRTVRRPQYERMASDYAAGRFEAIICYDLDRLTRQPRQLEDWIDAAEERGLVLVTLNGEADLSTDGGRMYARVKAAVARSEVERKGARQSRALAQRAELGRVPLGVRLTGYHGDGTVNEEEARVVRRIFSSFAVKDSIKGIVDALNAEGVPARGDRWTPSTVRTILTNPRYAGRVVYRGRTTGALGSWEPLIDGDEFDAVQATLSDPRRKMNREGTARKHLGAGLYRCGGCGRALQSNGGRYWCKSGSCLIRTMRPVDETVLDFVREVLGIPDVAALVAPSRSQEGKALDGEAKQLRARLSVIDADYDDGVIDGQRHRVASEKVAVRLREVEARRADLLADRALGSVLGTPSPVATFDAASLDVKRAVIDALVIVRLLPVPRGRRGFDPETVAIDFRHFVASADGSTSPTLGRDALDLLRSVALVA